jgi:hypothetical protein
MLPTFEKRYRIDHNQEHAVLFDAQGKLLVERTGDEDSVAFDPQELNRACGGLLSHTHPHAKPPSKADLEVAARYGLTLRAVGVAGDGTQWDYTVAMPGVSPVLADELAKHFDDELEQAEKELAAKPLSDRAWEREARHLAVIRLARQYGFFYQRVQPNAHISETTRHEIARLNTLSSVERTMRAEWLSPLHASLVRNLNRHADEKGLIPISRMEMVRRLSAGLVVRSMLGQAQPDGTLEPYRVQHGDVQPNSPYFKALWQLMIQAAQLAVAQQAKIMRKYLPADLIRLFESAVISPFGEDVQEMADYDPLHLWLGPDNKRLSDRIWNATGDMRRKLDAYLTAAITRNVPVSQMAKDLEQFLQPGAGPFEAMRLARTEVAAAGSRAESAAAGMNPLVESYQPFTVPEHACCDNCDDIVAKGPYPKNDITHLPPYHPHCICGVIWNIVKDVKAVVDNLRAQIEQAIAQAKRSIADFIGPLSRRFLALLFRGSK